MSVPLCSVCGHAKVAAVERALLAGGSFREIGRRYGLGKNALHRHRHSHMATGDLVDAEDVRAVAVVDRMERLCELIERKLEWADRSGTPTAFANIARELRASLELVARLRRELDDRPQVNILVSGEWARVRGVLLAALQPYPEARAALGPALVELEESSV